jgi:putative endonuclease
LEYLKKEGYLLLHQNYRNKCGEIDIIARKDGYLVFIEVKTRTDLTYGSPLESIDSTKIKRIRRAADIYIASNKTTGLDIRFDVITIIINRDLAKKISKEDGILNKKLNLDSPENNSFLEIEHIKDAF